MIVQQNLPMRDALIEAESKAYKREPRRVEARLNRIKINE